MAWVRWLRWLLRKPVPRRWDRLPVQIDWEGDIPDPIVEAIKSATILINHDVGRTLVSTGRSWDPNRVSSMRSDSRVLVAFRAGQVAPIKTIVVEHVERRSIEGARIMLGEHVLQTEDLAVADLAESVARALGASSREELALLYR